MNNAAMLTTSGGSNEAICLRTKFTHLVLVLWETDDFFVIQLSSPFVEHGTIHS